MKNFLRVVGLTLRRRFTFVAAVACSIGVALFWGGNLALIKPMIEIVFTNKKPHDLADAKLAEARNKLVTTRQELATVDAALAKAPAEKRGDLQAQQRRLAQRLLTQESAVRAGEFLQPLVHRFLPNDTFATLAIFVAAFVLATLVKDAMLVGNMLFVERLTQL